MAHDENTDEFFKRIQEDELKDATKLTPRDYARSRGMSSPQLVYYHIRNHKEELSLELCQCGRKVLDVKAADAYFGFNQDNNDPEGNDNEAEDTDGASSCT
jgi:hypothetical protein